MEKTESRVHGVGKGSKQIVRALDLQKGSGTRGPRNLWVREVSRLATRKIGWKSLLGAVRLLGPFLYLVLHDNLSPTPAEDWRDTEQDMLLYQMQLRWG